MKPFHIFLAILMAAIWGINFIITKIGLRDFPPIFFTCLRYSVIAFPLVLFIRKDGLSWPLILKTGLFLGTLTFTLAFIGIELGVPAGMTSLIMQAQVIFTLILSTLLLKDRPGIAQIIGVGLSFLGVLLLIWNFHASSSLVGLMFVLGGSLCLGITNIVMKKGGNYDTFRLMVWMSIVPPIPLLMLSLIFETGQMESLMKFSLPGIGAILFNAFISTILGFGLLGYLIKLYSPNAVAPYFLLVPVFGLAAGYLVLGETLSFYNLVACLIIMAGLAYPRYAPRFLKLAVASRG